MKKYLIQIVIGLVLLLAFSTFIVLKYSPNIFVSVPHKNPAAQTKATSSDIILFIGDGCPHCAIVEKYLSDNNVLAKISYAQKEVFNNTGNANLLGDKAHSCGLNTDNIGVPFLWDGPSGKCYVGDEDVVNYFKNKLGQ
jgi:glutaredoxin